MANSQALLELALQLADIQIKKYQNLATIGMGPDAHFSASIIRSQVVRLLKNIESFLNLETIRDEDKTKLAQNLKFYLDCEYLRGRAGCLLDENPIHNTAYERVTNQLADLKTLCEEIDGWHELAQADYTPIQQQYLHDSQTIAFRILDMVIKLKENPERSDLAGINPEDHGFKIMQKHAQAGGRYYDEEIGAEIIARHAESEAFLTTSPLEKSTSSLNKEQAKACIRQDREQFNALFTQFLEKHPNSRLAKKDSSWFEVAHTKTTASHTKKTSPQESWVKWGFFAAGIVVVGAAAAASVSCEPGEENSWPQYLGLC